MNAVTIISPAVNALDAAQLQRADDLAPRSVYILHYIAGSLITMGGPYHDAETAISAHTRDYGEVGRWIEMQPGQCRSEDGRWLIR